MPQLPDTRSHDRAGMSHPAIPRGVRVYFWSITTILLGYGLYGVVTNDLVVPGGRHEEALHIHNPWALVALLALVCFCLALRSAILDRWILFGDDSRLRYRASTFALLILSFALVFVAMMPRS